MEFRALLVDFDTTSEVTGTDISTPLFPSVQPEELDYLYTSQVFSFELNTKRAINPGLVVLCGCRFISIEERSQFDFTENLTTPVGNLVFTGGSEVLANNNIMGFQGGFEFNVPVCQGIYVSSVNKFGGYYNPTEVTTTNFDSINGSTQFKQSKATGTFVAELGGRLNFEVVPNCLTCFVGYDAMWIDGIALAPPQFLTTNPLAGVDTTNTPFFQSIIVGVNLGY